MAQSLNPLPGQTFHLSLSVLGFYLFYSCKLLLFGSCYVPFSMNLFSLSAVAALPLMDILLVCLCHCVQFLCCYNILYLLISRFAPSPKWRLGSWFS